MAKHKVDRAASEGADEAVLNLQQVDALATLKKKIEEGVDAFSNDPAHKAKFRRLLNDHQYKLLRIWEGNI